tara:strand:- start:2023 stop:2307 length:285 start_codon:yes stop_codon:yes gene_type:complete
LDDGGAVFAVDAEVEERVGPVLAWFARVYAWPRSLYFVDADTDTDEGRRFFRCASSLELASYGANLELCGAATLAGCAAGHAYRYADAAAIGVS